MRCQKAQQLMNDRTFGNEAINIRLAEHIRGCKNCATHAVAGQILSRAFRSDRVRAGEPETPLSFLKSRIEARASQQSVKEHKVMSSLKERILSHPLMSFGFAGIFVVLVLAATVPVSCNRTVGYSVGVDSDDSPIANAITSDADGTASITFQKDADGNMMFFDSRRIIEALHTLGISNVNLNVSANEQERTITISGLENREQARDALLAIVEVSGVGDKAKLTSREASVSGTLLEHCLSGIHEILIDSDGLSDEEVQIHIVAKLQEAGVLNADVQYLTGEDGQKMIFIGSEGECDSTALEQVIEWKTNGGDPTFNFEGCDTSIVIEIKSDGNQETVEVQKLITIDSDQ
jgi:hypothetical protein